MLILLIDIGNTRIKWATLSASGIGPQQAASYAAWDQTDIATQVLAHLSKPERVVISSVGDERILKWIVEAVAARWQLVPDFVHASATAGGIRNAYTTPEQLGVDRWLAMIAAYNLVRDSVCVVSIGTAMTIDGIDRHGRHLGGVIVPGPDLAVESLLQNTSDLAKRSRAGKVSSALFADNTLGAIQQGVRHMLASLVERSIAAMQGTAAAPTIVLTGGGAEHVQPLLLNECRFVPDLVLQGLAIVAQSERRS